MSIHVLFCGRTCKYLHYEVDAEVPLEELLKSRPPSQSVLNQLKLTEPQWINCDVRKLDWSLLGKFDVVMADPPWDIHMDLPYGAASSSTLVLSPFESSP